MKINLKIYQSLLFKVLRKFAPDKFKLFIPIGYNQVNNLREKKFIEARDKGYDFISYIHPKTTISSNAKIGKNCFIFEDNSVQPYVTIEVVIFYGVVIILVIIQL